MSKDPKLTFDATDSHMLPVLFVCCKHVAKVVSALPSDLLIDNSSFSASARFFTKN